MTLEGQVAIVTGAARGIGKGIALELAKAGADVAVTDICGPYGPGIDYDLGTMEQLEQTAKEIRDLGRKSIAIKCNVVKWDEVQAMAKKTLDEFGKIDIMCSNAGLVTVNSTVDLTEEEWDAVMDVNAKGVWLCAKAVLPHMLERKSGCIINTASIAGKYGYGGLPHYVASKHACAGFTRSLSAEVAETGVRVNAICPGIVYTKMWEILSEEWKLPGKTAKESYPILVEGFIPQKVDQTAEDMGKLAVFFAENPHIHGQCINIDGGHAFY